MISSKNVLCALAGMSSLQAMAAPMADVSETQTSQLSERQSDQSLYSSAADVNECLWSSGMLYVSWSILMTQFDGKSVPDMYSALVNGLNSNSACNSFSWMEAATNGVGAQNTTGMIMFNTDDFCTAADMSGILNGVTGSNNFACGDSPPEGDPDPSNLLAETPGEPVEEDPSEVERRRKRSNHHVNTAVLAKTAHPVGLANLTQATTINGTKIHSVAEMAKKAGLPATAARAKVIDALNAAAAKKLGA